MARKPAVLIDLNIILDVLQKREPFYDTSAALLSAAETGRMQGCLAAHSITTLFYLIQKGVSVHEARATITNLSQFLKIAAINQATIEQALNLDYPDFEDALQMMAAVQGRMEYLITRNTRGYKPALLPVIQPVDFLGTL